MNVKLAAEYLRSNPYLKKLEERATRIQEAEKDLDKREKLVKGCMADPVLFIETFGWTKLTEMNRTIPFFLWDYQKEIIWKLQRCEADIEREHEVLIDKPREMGVTWVVVWYLMWRWLFRKGWSAFILSRTEVEVDRGNDEPGSSIFGKFRWSFQRLPSWIMPASYRPKSGQRGTMTDRNLQILNPDMETALIGSTTNSNAGRSLRYSLTFVDEAFAIEGFNNMYRSIQSVSRVKLFASTVRVGSVFKKFKDLCESNGDYISLKWQQHPWKDEEWFEQMKKKAEVDPEVMKELSVDYNVNIQAQYYPEIKESKVIPIQYNPNLPVYVSFDFGSKDLTVIVWHQFSGKDISVIECYSGRRRDLDWYVPFLNPHLITDKKFELIESQYHETSLGLIKKLTGWRKPVSYFGEAAHFQKHMPSNRSVADELVKYGIRLQFNRYALSHRVRRNATAALLPRCSFNQDSPYVMELYDALGASRFNNAIRSVTSEDSLMRPVHDPETADYRSAFENFTTNFTRIMRLQRDAVKEKGGVDSLTKSLYSYLRL